MDDLNTPDLSSAVVERLTSVLGAGPIGVFQEIIPDVVGLNLAIFPPVTGRETWVVCTLGSASAEMPVPDHLPDPDLWRRAEYMVILPADWLGLDRDQGIVGGAAHYYPMTVLKKVARYPHEHGAFLGPGSSVEFADALGPQTDMKAALIWWPGFAKTDDDISVTVGDTTVNLYQVVPIHQSEAAFARQNGSAALCDGLASSGQSQIFDLHRPALAEAS